MTIIAPEPALDDATEGLPLAPPSGVAHRLSRAWTSVVAHSAVDFLSFVPIALMPALRHHASLTDGQVAAIIATHAASSGAIQPAAAWFSDRFDQRAIGAIGVIAAGIGVGGLYLADSFAALFAMTILTAGGVGAFHPPAAAAVGSLAGAARGRWMSIFFVAGMLGGILGNTLSPGMAKAVGLQGLGWLVVPAVLVSFVLWLAIRKVPHRAHDAHESHARLSPQARRARWSGVGLLYASSVLRFGVNNALIYLMVAIIERRVLAEAAAASLTENLAERASSLNGMMQAAMQIGMGGGGLVLGWFLAQRHEKAALVVIPVLGAVALAAIPSVSDLSAALFVVTIVAGIGFGSVIPVTLSLAQRMLPHRTSLASSLMLGGAWMFAGIGPLSAQKIEAAMGLQAAFWAIAAALILAGLLAIALPSKLMKEIA